MPDENQADTHHHKQETEESLRHQPPSSPAQSGTFFSMQEKPTKKFLVLFTLLLGLTLGGLLIFFLIKPDLPKDQSQKNSSAEIITEDDWKNIKNKIAESYLYRYLDQQLQKKPKNLFSKSASTAENFFITAYQYGNIPSGSINTKTNVLGEATNTTSFDQEIESSLSKVRLSGAINNSETKTVDEYDLLITNLVVQNKTDYSGISDFLINGKIGDLDLGGPDFDALHLSIIEPDQSTAYIKASISDIFLIFLDRLIYGPDPEASKSGIISAQYDDIYPYFDHYVEVTNNDLTNENKALEEPLPEDLFLYLNDYSNFKSQTFYNTLGNPDNYLKRKEVLTDVLAGESIIRIKTEVDTLSFLKQLDIFLTETDRYAKDNKEIFEQYCQNDNLESEKICLSLFGYTEEEDYSSLLALAPMVKFDKFDIILDNNSKNFLGIDLNISFDENIFNPSKNNFPDENSGLKEIKNLNIQLSYINIPPDKITAIGKPSSYIQFLPNGTTVNKEEQIKNNTEELAEQIFLKNHHYVYEVWEEDLEKLSQNKSTYCQTKWEPKFCLIIGADWEENKSFLSHPDIISFLYPSRHRGTKTKNASLEFTNKSIGEGFLCDEQGYEGHTEVKTKDGLVFRIYEKKLAEKGPQQDNFLLDVCYQNQNGKFTTVSPLAKSISIFSQQMTLEETLQRTSAILETITLKDPSQANLTENYSEPLQKYETLYLGKAKEDPNSCSIGFYRDENGYSKTYENIKKDLLIEQEFNDLVVEENTLFCQWPEIETEGSPNCLRCVKGQLEWAELSECKGLSCNP